MYTITFSIVVISLRSVCVCVCVFALLWCACPKGGKHEKFRSNAKRSLVMVIEDKGFGTYPRQIIS